MDTAKRRALEAAGWQVSSGDFLGLADDELALMELKLALGQAVKERRLRARMTRGDVAVRIDSGPACVDSMEAGDSSVSIDLFVYTLLALGATRRELARAFLP